jgi:uncharacterized protein
MDDELLETYIVQHIDASADPVIQFSWHGGEPTLYGLDGFRNIVAFQKQHCPKGRTILNGIQTNGLIIDAAWCRFLAEERFFVGLSLDGPAAFHDPYRLDPRGGATHYRVENSFRALSGCGVPTECLCVVHSGNVRYPLEIYDYFVRLGVPYLTFLPLVAPFPNGRVSERTVPSDAWGEFLCAIFDRWLDRDIGRVKIQLFEETARTAFGLDHTLCVLSRTCGGVPMLDADGDVYSCDHFVEAKHRLGNIREKTLSAMLDSPQQDAFGRAKMDTLAEQCRSCDVLDMCNGGCPKDRITKTQYGKSDLNYLCSGYKKFFLHCRPFIEALAHVWGQQKNTV